MPREQNHLAIFQYCTVPSYIAETYVCIHIQWDNINSLRTAFAQCIIVPKVLYKASSITFLHRSFKDFNRGHPLAATSKTLLWMNSECNDKFQEIYTKLTWLLMKHQKQQQQVHVIFTTRGQPNPMQVKPSKTANSNPPVKHVKISTLFRGYFPLPCPFPCESLVPQPKQICRGILDPITEQLPMCKQKSLILRQCDNILIQSEVSLQQNDYSKDIQNYKYNSGSSLTNSRTTNLHLSTDHSPTSLTLRAPYHTLNLINPFPATAKSETRI